MYISNSSKNCFYLLPFLKFFSSKIASSIKNKSWESFVNEYENISKILRVDSVIICYLVYLEINVSDLRSIESEFGKERHCVLHDKAKIEYKYYLHLLNHHQKM